jgi:membrane protein YqaA with SNARE-associated domain
MLAAGQGQPTILVIAASLGNVAGAVLNWLLGRFFSNYENRAWFPIKRDAAKNARRWFQSYGVWSLLFSWVPVIGDPLTLVAGALRIDFWRFLLFVTIGKTLRYLAIVSGWQQLATG